MGHPYIRIDKSEESIDVEDLRLSEEKNKDCRVVADADTTPDRARAFELIMSSWTHEAGMGTTQLNKLNYDSVEEATTEGIINRLLAADRKKPAGPAVGSPSGSRPGTSGADEGSDEGSEKPKTDTFTRGDPDDAAGFNELLTSPLGFIALDILEFTPLATQVKSITIGSFSESNPFLEILFERDA